LPGPKNDLGSTEADRVENIRRVAEMAKLLLEAELITMVAFISPFRAERQMARELVALGEFIEKFFDVTPCGWSISGAIDPLRSLTPPRISGLLWR
jgi:adenylylsulfate kinase-like enzyme